MINLAKKLVAKTFHGNKITPNSFAAQVKKAKSKTRLEVLLGLVKIGCTNPKTVKRRIALINAKLA